MTDPELVAALSDRAKALRRHVVTIASHSPTHLGGSMSSADLMAALFFHWLRLEPDEAGRRDHFILSKGHAVHILHACLVERGLLEEEELETCSRAGSRLGGHPTLRAPGVEFATGSLGHGLSVGFGLALAESHLGSCARAVVLLGDGELQEGSVWEAALSAPRFGLENLLAIVDANGFQACGRTEDVVPVEPIAEKWRAFRWNVQEIDGHDMEGILESLDRVPAASGPSVIVAHTTKGKGVPGIEGTLGAHYTQLGPEERDRALAAIGGAT